MEHSTCRKFSPQALERFAQWKTWMEVSRGLLPKTRTLYVSQVSKAAADLGDLTHLNTEDLEQWITRKGGSGSSVSNRISALACFYKFLVKTKVRPDNPALELDRPKRHKGLPRPVQDLDEALASLDALDFKRDRRVGETRAMVVFLCETGLRIHEAVAINVPVPAGDVLRLIGKGAKEAIIPLTDKAREAIDFLGGRWPVGIRATQRRFELATPRFSPHMCRHWRGTSMADAGADLGDIQAMLRHASPATTLTYAAWSTDRVRAALGKVS